MSNKEDIKTVIDNLENTKNSELKKLQDVVKAALIVKFIILNVFLSFKAQASDQVNLDSDLNHDTY